MIDVCVLLGQPGAAPVEGVLLGGAYLIHEVHEPVGERGRTLLQRAPGWHFTYQHDIVNITAEVLVTCK